MRRARATSVDDMSSMDDVFEASRRVESIEVLPSGAGGCLRSRRAASSTTRGAAGRRSASARRRRLARARSVGRVLLERRGARCRRRRRGAAPRPPPSTRAARRVWRRRRARWRRREPRELGRVRGADPGTILADDDTGDSVLGEAPSARRARRRRRRARARAAADASSSSEPSEAGPLSDDPPDEPRWSRRRRIPAEPEAEPQMRWPRFHAARRRRGVPTSGGSRGAPRRHGAAGAGAELRSRAGGSGRSPPPARNKLGRAARGAARRRSGRAARPRRTAAHLEELAAAAAEDGAHVRMPLARVLGEAQQRGRPRHRGAAALERLDGHVERPVEPPQVDLASPSLADRLAAQQLELRVNASPAVILRLVRRARLRRRRVATSELLPPPPSGDRTRPRRARPVAKLSLVCLAGPAFSLVVAPDEVPEARGGARRAGQRAGRPRRAHRRRGGAGGLHFELPWQ